MKPKPVSDELFELMKTTGLSTITLSLNTLDDTPSTFEHIKSVIRIAQNKGISILVDLSVRAPYEDISLTD